VPERLRELVAVAVALSIGAAAFLAYCGWTVLIPTNIAWLAVGDRAMHQLGWMFYRAAPWGWPPGASPRLGIELANSIALVDGLPLLALPFKLAAPLLPEPFQYWGWWLLASFMLQAGFAYAVARALAAGRGVALAAAAFAVIAPAFLFRVPLHMALSSHFVLLAGLYLYLRRPPPAWWMWPLLAAATAAIHATLLAMVLALWGAALVERLWRRRLAPARAAAEAALLGGATLAMLSLVGFFGIGSYGAGGYGDYKLNLAWPLLTYGWSTLLPELPHTRFDYEGLSFPGLGILGLLLVAALAGARQPMSRRALPLMAMLLALMAFAVSRSPSFGAIELGTLPMPAFVNAVGSAFRSTGRFVWPLLYLVTIGAVVLVGRRFRPRVALPLLAVAFAVQVADSAPAWQKFMAQLPSPSATWPTPLASPLWARAAAAGYDRVRAIPNDIGIFSDFQAVGYYAVTHGMDTDIAYLGRVDARARMALAARKAAQLETGAFEPRTLYLLDVPSALAVMAHLRPGDLLATIDGRIVFARGGAPLVDGLGIDPVPMMGGRAGAAVAYGGAPSP
jgi:hypothetical protein